jgi:hypothetical protein
MQASFLCQIEPLWTSSLTRQKTLVGALGWDLFREVRGKQAESLYFEDVRASSAHFEDIKFFFRGQGFSAEMKLSHSGDIVVLCGSTARVKTTSTIPRGTFTLRKTLLESGVLREQGDYLVFTSNYSFSSPSAAAATVIGASANGRILWKLPDGLTYADWESNKDNAEDQGEDAPDTLEV